MGTDQREETAGIQQAVRQNDFSLHLKGLAQCIQRGMSIKELLISKREIQAEIGGGIDGKGADGSRRHIQGDAKEPHRQPHHPRSKE
jgi:hypothetical protein